MPGSRKSLEGKRDSLYRKLRGGILEEGLSPGKLPQMREKQLCLCKRRTSGTRARKVLMDRTTNGESYAKKPAIGGPELQKYTEESENYRESPETLQRGCPVE